MKLVKIKQKEYKKMLKLQLKKIKSNIRTLKIRKVTTVHGFNGALMMYGHNLQGDLISLKNRKNENKKELALLEGLDQKYMLVDIKTASLVSDYLKEGYSLNDGLIK